MRISFRRFSVSYFFACLMTSSRARACSTSFSAAADGLALRGLPGYSFRRPSSPNCFRWERTLLSRPAQALVELGELKHDVPTVTAPLHRGLQDLILAHVAGGHYIWRRSRGSFTILP